MTDKETKLEKKLKELQNRHMWSCAYNLAQALDEHSDARAGFNWPAVARAAYHAGAAKVIQEALF